jgi:hypothetical protein
MQKLRLKPCLILEICYFEFDPDSVIFILKKYNCTTLNKASDWFTPFVCVLSILCQMGSDFTTFFKMKSYSLCWWCLENQYMHIPSKYISLLSGRMMTEYSDDKWLVGDVLGETSWRHLKSYIQWGDFLLFDLYILFKGHKCLWLSDDFFIMETKINPQTKIWLFC